MKPDGPLFCYGCLTLASYLGEGCNGWMIASQAYIPTVVFLCSVTGKEPKDEYLLRGFTEDQSLWEAQKRPMSSEDVLLFLVWTLALCGSRSSRKVAFLFQFLWSVTAQRQASEWDSYLVLKRSTSSRNKNTSFIKVQSLELGREQTGRIKMTRKVSISVDINRKLTNNFH